MKNFLTLLSSCAHLNDWSIIASWIEDGRTRGSNLMSFDAPAPCWNQPNSNIRVQHQNFLITRSMTFLTVVYTLSGEGVQSIWSKSPMTRKTFSTAAVFALKVRSRFLIVSILSSDLPLVLARSKSLRTISSSGQEKNIDVAVLKLFEHIFSQASRFSRLRGKPSITKYLEPPFSNEASIAVFSRPQVISEGTSFPSLMMSLISFPTADPLRVLSALNKSPVERWVNPKSLATFAH
mmetsp:Transcript_15541/g.25305  ORF Transcript_15541/g.25305 Transcript_15541/m.25305 type:complete len:236 (-) Transcript_15541:1073-1780(-)